MVLVINYLGPYITCFQSQETHIGRMCRSLERRISASLASPERAKRV